MRWELPRGSFGSISAAPKRDRSTFTAAAWTHQHDGRRCSVSRTAATPAQAVQRLRAHLEDLGLVDARAGTLRPFGRPFGTAARVAA